ncbi:hypothetical protein CRM22_004119 [Opisthorchis felineus]|uniref:Bromodomain adjacent to zinc finger domain protein 1A n=1 Tax=Opisthorchis felineus TaxID=147828 RepID=A0A4S2LXT1_OPIFE|nr:hypothetical protein CRM22_004119 [Opisthorchis felineus]
MPLLGARLHVLNPVWKKKKVVRDEQNPVELKEEEDKPPFIVPETQEVCTSAQELQQKTTVYGRNVWTCRVTGRSNLTYRDAAKSEATSHRILKKNFPKCFEKPVLETVHLSTLPLENLVHSCWTGLQEQFYVTEPVKLKVDSVSSQPIHGIINEVDKSHTVDSMPVSNTGSNTSPNSSDKENVTKRTTPVKKNYAYTVKVLSDVPLVVNDVPACSIDRLNRIPSKEHIRMFIRAHAMRYGPNFSGPWIVDADLLRRYKITSKSPGFEVDRVKLKQMSNAIEAEYLARLIKNDRQANVDGTLLENGTLDSLPTPIVKRGKRFSVLREENVEQPEDELPLTAFKKQTKKHMAKSPTEEFIKKKMKQVTLFQFSKNAVKQTPSSSTVNTVGPTPTKLVPSSPPALPRAAQQLMKLAAESSGNPLITSCINICAKILCDADIARLPAELREKVCSRREAIQFHKKLLSMTPDERKAYLRENREKQRLERMKANRLCDDQDLLATDSRCVALPQTSPLHLPDGFTEPLFGRLLSVAEFFHCFQTLLMEGLDYADQDVPAEAPVALPTVALTPLESAVPSRGDPGYSEDDEQLNTEDEEEEVALIEATAPLPKVSARCFRRLGLQRLLKAVSTSMPTAGSYRSLARPICLLLRLLLRDEELAKRRELGIRLAKLPVTPYTAPELLRLTLLHGTTDCTQKSELIRLDSSADNENGDSHVSTPDYFHQDNLHALLHKLTTFDIYQLCPESRLVVLETVVQRLFDLDLIDDHILACQRRALQAHNRKIKFMRDRNVRKKEEDHQRDASSGRKKHEESKTPSAETKVEPGTPTTPADGDGAEGADGDLASIVKRRRILAARAAAEREEKEAQERERRAAQTKVVAEERLLAQVSKAYELCKAEAHLALRCQPIGLDRYHRRIWFFRCAPDRLFVESDWASPYVNYSVLQPQDLTDNYIDLTKDEHTASRDVEERETTVPAPAHLVTPYSPDSISVGSSWSSWSVYDKPEQLDELASALFERGIRESRLKRHLCTDSLLDSIKSHWKKKIPSATTHSECPAVEAADSVTETPKSFSGGRMEGVVERVSGKRFLDAGAALAGALLKNILDTEVRLRSGGLGGVPDFTKWQENLADVHASFGLPPETSPKKNSLPKPIGSPRQPDRLGLINALLAVADNVMPRFLNVPDLTEKTKRKRNKDGLPDTDQPNGGRDVNEEPDGTQSTEETNESDSDSSQSSSATDHLLRDPDLHATRTRAWLSTWRNEVMNARTLARLNLLHACLDACIRWEKSVEDARCRICRHKSDDDNLLLCDGCNRAFHLYCLRPPLRRVPAGDWYCPSCRPASRDLERRRREARLARSERRRRRQDVASSEDEDSVVPERESAARDKVGPKHDTTCLVCAEATSSSELVHCTNCPNAFHLSCHNPPLRHPPRGDVWLCTSCRTSGRKNNFLGPKYLPRNKRRTQYLASCGLPRSAVEASGDDDIAVHPSTRISRSSSTRKLISTWRDQETTEVDESDTELDTETPGRPRRSKRSISVRKRSTGARSIRQTKRRRLDSSASSEASSASSSESEPRVESTRKSKVDVRACVTRILNAIYRHKCAWPFREPVDREEVPDYYEIITDPVDLGMVRAWISNGRYDAADPKEGLRNFACDLGTMFYNAELYNAADSDVWIAGSQLEQFVKNQFSQLNMGISYHREALGS